MVGDTSKGDGPVHVSPLARTGDIATTINEVSPAALAEISRLSDERVKLALKLGIAEAALAVCRVCFCLSIE